MKAQLSLMRAGFLPTTLMNFSLLFVLVGTGCMSVPTTPLMSSQRTNTESRFLAGEQISVEKPGVVAKIPMPPRGGSEPAYAGLTPMFGAIGVPQVMAGQRKTNEANTRLAASECAKITESDGQEYDLLVISPNQTSEATGRAAYRVILWNSAGFIDWHAEIWFDVFWESARKPYATIVYRNTKEDSCLFVENGSTEGTWKVAQQMRFGKGAPAKELASKARPLASFPRRTPARSQ